MSDNNQEEQEVVYNAFIRLTRSVALWIVNHGRVLLDDGVGDTGDNGLLDEIPMDTPAYRYAQELYRLVQTIVGIMQYEIAFQNEEQENINPLAEIFEDDNQEI